jgi:uncharacterized protein (DUF2252 family)
MTPLDPAALARFQLQHDRSATRKFPGLYQHKLERMSASPLAFLRGAAPLYYEILKARPELAKGPGGEGWLTGDMHLENYGAYRPDPHSFPGRTRETPEATFDLNDFDDAVIGPFFLDVLRLSTSLILGGRELGADGVNTLGLCHELLDAYTKALAGKVAKDPLPAPIRALMAQVTGRSQSELLDARTRGHGDSRRFTMGDRYQKLEATVARGFPAAFKQYVASLRTLDPGVGADHFEIVDTARRIAGTGSLGCIRVAVLTHGKGGHDGQWIFDLKEQGTPSAASLLGTPKTDPAVRVITAARACLEHPPRMLGTTHLGRTPLFGRRIAPQEDKLDLGRVHHGDLEPLASSLGMLLGRAHRRGATTLPKKAWTEAERAELIDHAIVLAGIHEAVYLALCKEIMR